MDEILLLETPSSIVDSYDDKWLDELRCFISPNGKLTMSVEDHDGSTWYFGEPLDNVLDKLNITHYLKKSIDMACFRAKLNRKFNEQFKI